MILSNSRLESFLAAMKLRRSGKTKASVFRKKLGRVRCEELVAADVYEEASYEYDDLRRAKRQLEEAATEAERRGERVSWSLN